MFSPEPRRATARERRRKGRRDLSESDRARERATSRHRMAVYRARKKAQNGLRLLKLQLSDAERAAVEERSANKRHEMLCDWFRSHRVTFDARISFTKEVVESFVSKVEMHQMELSLAEYEIALITGVGVGGDAVDEGGIHQVPSSTDRGGSRGRLTKGVATANSKRGIATARQGRQQQGGSIGTCGLAEANSTRAGAFGSSNYQAPWTATREGDRGKLLKKCVTPDSTSTHAFVGGSYQEQMKGKINGAFGNSNYQVPSSTAREGDQGKLPKKCATADSTSTHAFVGSSCQELLKDEINGAFGSSNYQVPSSMTREGDHGKLLKKCATADSTSTQAFVGGSYQEQMKGKINGAFGSSNYQVPSSMTREGDQGKLLKKCATADSTSTQAFVGSSYQEQMKGEIKHCLPSQISGDGDPTPASHPDSAGTQLFDPRLSDEQVNDFLFCFGGNPAEENAPTDSSSRNPRAFGDGNVQAMPTNDEIDRFFANFETVKDGDFPASLPANEEEGTGPTQVFADTLQQKIDSLEAELETKVFGKRNLLDTEPSSNGAETIPRAASPSIFGEEDPGPAGPSETAVIYGEGVAPAGRDGGDVLSGRSADSDGAGIYGEGVAPAGSYGGNVISGSSVVSDGAGSCGEGVAPAGGGSKIFPGRSVDSNSDSFDIESLGECMDSDLLQW